MIREFDQKNIDDLAAIVSGAVSIARAGADMSNMGNLEKEVYALLAVPLIAAVLPSYPVKSIKEALFAASSKK